MGNVEMPKGWRDLTKGVVPVVTRVPARAGDAIIFTEALTHGTLPWTADPPADGSPSRQTLFYKFSPHATSWSADHLSANYFTQYPDWTDRRSRIVEPPNARYVGRP